MENWTQNKSVKIAKILVPNLIPVVGILLLGWGMFEVALTYLLETFLVFFIFFFDRYFIAKKTRYPAPFAMIQLFFLIIPFCGLLYMYSFICFRLIENVNSKGAFDDLGYKLEEINIWWVIFAMLIFESINFYINNQNGRQHKTATVWYNIRKLLFVHLFVVGSSFLIGLFHEITILPILFVICFKIILDYAVEDELFFTKIRHRIAGTFKIK